jgi:integrase
MGMLYKRKYRRKDGTIAESAVWCIKYYRNGKPMRESSESEKETVAKNLLKKREGAVANGQRVTPRMDRVTFDELAADVVNDYKANGKRSIDDLNRRLDLHLKPYFTGWRASNISTTDVRSYITKRQSEKAANGTINRELATLKRAFTLGIDAGKLSSRPKISMLREDSVRIGFFEPEQFQAVRMHLSKPLQALVSFAYITGWRIRSEVLRLQWRQVDFEAGTVRLDAGTTKNGEGRLFPFTQELRRLLEAQREYTRQIEREQGIICPWVFHRDGKPIRVFRRAWDKACEKAGCPGRIPHDFRRTAVRNLVRASIPERVAMTLTGHKTRSVFERYNIVSEGDLLDAARRLDAAATKLTGTVRAQSTEKRASLDVPTAVSY